MVYEILLDLPSVTVRYEPNDKYIYHTFHTALKGEPFRQALNVGADHLIKTSSTKWLSDDRLNDALSPEDAAFGIAEWGPRAAAGGWKFWALVVPESIAGRASLQDTVEAYYNLGVRVRVFSDLEKARAWLVEQ